MLNEVKAIADELGGKSVLGRLLKTETDLRAAIRRGFPQPVVTELMAAAGLTLKELAAIVDLSPRSLQRRHREGHLASYESDRLYRLARTIALAKHYIGDEDAAIRWLKRSNPVFGGSTPLEVLDTESGARSVENVLGRIAYGGIS